MSTGGRSNKSLSQSVSIEETVWSLAGAEVDLLEIWCKAGELVPDKSEGRSVLDWTLADLLVDCLLKNSRYQASL